MNPPDFKRARAEAARKCSSAAGRALVVQCAHPARATSRIVMEALASELDHEGKPEKAACFRLLNNILKQRTKFRTMHDITAMSFDRNNTCFTAVLQWHRYLQASSCASRTHRFGGVVACFPKALRISISQPPGRKVLAGACAGESRITPGGGQVVRAASARRIAGAGARDGRPQLARWGVAGPRRM